MQMIDHQISIKNILLTAIAPLIVIGYPFSTQAQTTSEDPPSLEVQYNELIEMNQAKNLARQAAERANGGLTEYRVEPAMHGPAQKTNYKELSEGVWQFTFQGRRPSSDEYTIETVVVVNTNNDEITMKYNGPIRD